MILAALLFVDLIKGALDSSALWTMERRFTKDAAPIVASGRVDCKLGQEIVWTTLKPFDASVTMTTNQMIFTDIEGTRVKNLADMPHYTDIRLMADSLASGDETAFRKMFEVEGEVSTQTVWKIVLKPKVKEIRYLFNRMELSGEKELKEVVMDTAKGGSTVIKFKKDGD